MKKHVHIGIKPWDGKEYIILEISEEDYEFLKDCERRNIEYDEEMFWQVSEKEYE